MDIANIINTSKPMDWLNTLEDEAQKFFYSTY